MTEDEQFDEECKEQFKNYYEVLEVVRRKLGEQVQNFELEHVMLENINDLYEE